MTARSDVPSDAMLRRAAAVALLTVLAFAGCGGESSRPAAVPLGRDFQLAASRSTRVETLTVRFERVASDSRCPAGRECVWEGDATVMVMLGTSDGPMTAHELHTSHRFADHVTEDGYLLQLVDLRPGAGQATPATPYLATFRVTRA